MKIRNGFVSNSSSSSFLVVFPEKITNVEQLRKYLWTEKNSERIKDTYYFDESCKYAYVGMTFEEFKLQAEKVILKEINEQTPNNKLNVLSNFESDSWFDGNILNIMGLEVSSTEELNEKIKEYKNLEKEIENFSWEDNNYDEFEKLEDKKTDLYYMDYIISTFDEIDTHLSKYDGVFYSFSYSDEDGRFFSLMEHGGVFNELFTLVESKH
jgi:hypothetical protein